MHIQPHWRTQASQPSTQWPHHEVLHAHSRLFTPFHAYSTPPPGAWLIYAISERPNRFNFQLCAASGKPAQHPSPCPFPGSKLTSIFVKLCQPMSTNSDPPLFSAVAPRPPFRTPLPILSFCQKSASICEICDRQNTQKSAASNRLQTAANRKF